MKGLNVDPVCRSAWVARLKSPALGMLRPPTMARTAPSALITTMAACAFDPSLTLFSNTQARASSAFFCMSGSSVVSITTSSVVSRAR